MSNPKSEPRIEFIVTKAKASLRNFGVDSDLSRLGTLHTKLHISTIYETNGWTKFISTLARFYKELLKNSPSLRRAVVKLFLYNFDTDVFTSTIG